MGGRVCMYQSASCLRYRIEKDFETRCDQSTKHFIYPAQHTPLKNMINDYFFELSVGTPVYNNELWYEPTTASERNIAISHILWRGLLFPLGWQSG